MRMNKMTIKTKIRIKIIVLFFLVISIFTSLIVLSYLKKTPQPIENEINETSNVVTVKEDSELDKLKKEYEENRNINSDYVGQIYFDSKLIDFPFVQGSTDDIYMRTDWKTMAYDIGGSIFLEASNDLEADQNILIYGHNYSAEADPSITKMFSPLRALKDQSKYEENKIINLFLGDKIKKYEVVYVYSVKVLEEDGIQFLDEGEPYYDTINFSVEEFNEYINKVIERQFYSTGKTIAYNDKMLTLQTCIDNSLDKFIVVSRLISTEFVK